MSAGQFRGFESLVSLFEDSGLPQEQVLNRFKDILRDQSGCFGLVVETPQWIISVADQIRSYPIFLRYNDQLLTTVATRLPLDHASDTDISVRGIKEFLLCGYTLSNRTLFRDVRILPAGNLLIYDKKKNITEVKAFYRYLPAGSTTASKDLLIQQFGTLLDDIFRDLVVENKSRPIWLPLSGGLDSRLILAKLVEHGHKDVTTFSFGVRGNHEIRRARSVSKKLGVKWLNLPSRLHRLRSIYHSEPSQEYSQLCFSGQSSPIWLDFESVCRLMSRNLIPDSALMINGYSGDFLFGGHIPQSLIATPSLDNLVSSIVSKHCSHFLSPYFDDTKSRIGHEIKMEFASIYGDDTRAENLCNFYEYWDWKERQVKAVVMGQRLYDLFQIDWMLPFWDRRLMDFWSQVPMSQKLDQALHISYLKHYNYRGVFDQLRSENQLWTPAWRWVPAVGFLLKFCGGSRLKKSFYDYVYYYGFHRFQLGLFGENAFRRTSPFLRRPYVVPLSAYSFLRENGFSTAPDDVLFSLTN